jgi:hypothetical protein
LEKTTVAIILITLFVLLGPYLGLSLFGFPTSSILENELDNKKSSVKTNFHNYDPQDEMEQVSPEENFDNEIISEEKIDELSGL